MDAGVSICEKGFELADDENSRVFIYVLRKIVPDVSAKLLYYQQRYESIALKQLESRHEQIEIETNFVDYARNLYEIVEHENRIFPSIFLPESRHKVSKILEEITLHSRGETLFSSFKNALFHLALDNDFAGIKIYPRKCKKQTNFFEHLESFNKEFYSSECFESIKELIEKDKSSQNCFPRNSWSENYIEKDDKPIVKAFKHLTVLNLGYTLVKKAYCSFCTELFSLKKDLFKGDIKGISNLWGGLNIFGEIDEDMGEILKNLLKKHLETIKPCFMTRLAEYSSCIVNYKENTQVHFHKSNAVNTFENSMNFKMDFFKKMFLLVSDKKEFLNIYQEICVKRILNNFSSINLELKLIRCLPISRDDNLIKMINDLEENDKRDHLKILDENHWDFYITSEMISSSKLFLNEKLINLIRTELSNFEYDYKDKYAKYFYRHEGDIIRNLKISHRFSKLTVSINNQIFIFSLISLSLRAVEEDE